MSSGASRNPLMSPPAPHNTAPRAAAATLSRPAGSLRLRPQILMAQWWTAPMMATAAAPMIRPRTPSWNAVAFSVRAEERSMLSSVMVSMKLTIGAIVPSAPTTMPTSERTPASRPATIGVRTLKVPALMLSPMRARAPSVGTMASRRPATRKPLSKAIGRPRPPKLRNSEPKLRIPRRPSAARTERWKRRGRPVCTAIISAARPRVGTAIQ